MLTFTYCRAWQNNTTSWRATRAYFLALAAVQAWDRLIELARDLHDIMLDSGRTCLVDHLVLYFWDQPIDDFGKAFRAGGQPEFMKETMHQILDIVRLKGDDEKLVDYLHKTADLFYRYYDLDAESVKLYEEALDRLRLSDAATQRACVATRAQITNHVAQIHYDRAVAARKGKSSLIPQYFTSIHHE